MAFCLVSLFLRSRLHHFAATPTGPWTTLVRLRQVGKELNWVSTKTDGKFEVLVRFYGPEKLLFDKIWKLPDIKVVK